jgi:membrane associated rhomboid family serine protease
MSTCDECGKQENMPYHCRHCGGTFCAEHRLPENHSCPGLDNWSDPGGVFDSGFDDSVGGSSSGRSEGVMARLGINTGPGSIFSYFRGNMTYAFLGLMWLTFFSQLIIRQSVDSNLATTLFVLTPQNPEYVWTWVTSIFAHGSFEHIAVNSIVIFFFGRLVEDYIGTRDFVALFLVSGAIAGLGQIALMIYQGVGAGVVGASGAGLAIMGVLTVLNPNLRVYLYFLIPVPIWVLTAGFAVISTLGVFGIDTGIGGGNVADLAHLLGLAIGLVYGQHVKDRIRTPNQLQFGGGGPGGPGGPGGRRRGPF